jgi:hypothetical protein
MKKLISNIVLLIVLGSNLIFSQLPVVKISPAEMDIGLFTVGEIFVRVENISGFRAYSIELSYDAQKMRCLSITRADFFSNWNTFFFALIDSNANLLTVDEAILGVGYENGSGDLFKVQFLTLAEGDVNINFVNADLRDTLNNVIEVQTENGVVHIVNPTSVIADAGKYEIHCSIISYPNPFNSSTKIEFTSNRNEDTEFAIYSITGEKVYAFESKAQNSKSISFIWNGKDIEGNILPSGTYLFVARTQNEFRTFKLVMLK